MPRAEDVNQEGVRGVKGVIVKGPQFLRRSSFEELLKNYLGSLLTKQKLSDLQVQIRQYCDAHDHLVVDVITREQEVVDGTIQIAVVEGRVGSVTVKNEGHKWFSDQVILRDLRLKTNDVVLKSHLNNDLDWLNRDTYQSLGYFGGAFRDVTAAFSRGRGLGETSLDLEVRDRFPFRPFIGADDSGITPIGTQRVYGGFNWGNAFWVDHRLNYEYITDRDFDKLREHIASYVIPLPWRHELTVFGAYADVNPNFSTLSPNLATLRNKGIFYQASARYAIPLPRVGNLSHEITPGFDFKHTDTPLLFEATGGTAGGVLRTNDIDVVQFQLAYSGRVKDSWGTTAFSLQGIYSPGGLSSHNHNADFEDFAPGTDPRYVTSRAELRRETRLPYDFSWSTRGAGQYSDSKLVATEVFGIGGYDTARGYDERIVTGDHGWLFVNELRTPRLHLGLLNLPDWLQMLFFVDYAAAYNRRPLINQRYNDVLLSVGLGLRYEVTDHFYFRFDYGFQLDREYLTGPNAASLGEQPDQRAHFGVELAF